MAARTSKTETSKAADAALELLEGDFEDRAQEAQEFTVETSRGPWTVYSGPVSMTDLDKVQRLLSVPEEDDVPLDAMVDVLIILAHTEDGDLMFRKVHKLRLMEKVAPTYLVDAATFLAEVATEALEEAEEVAGKD